MVVIHRQLLAAITLLSIFKNVLEVYYTYVVNTIKSTFILKYQIKLLKSFYNIVDLFMWESRFSSYWQLL